MGAGEGRLAELASDLRRVSEELSDVAMDLLREALVEGTEQAGREAKEFERRLNRARGAVERAAHLLEGAPGAGGNPGVGGESD